MFDIALIIITVLCACVLFTSIFDEQFDGFKFFYVVCVVMIFLINVFFVTYANKKSVEDAYRLGQQDAVNGNVYYDINPNKILMERKK